MSLHHLCLIHQVSPSVCIPVQSLTTANQRMSPANIYDIVRHEGPQLKPILVSAEMKVSTQNQNCMPRLSQLAVEYPMCQTTTFLLFGTTQLSTLYIADYVNRLMEEILASDMPREDVQQTVPPPPCAKFTHPDKEMAIKQH